MTIEPAPRRSRVFGVWALVCAILAPLWLFGGFYTVLFAMADSAPAVLRALASIFAFGWFVAPLAVIAALALGILAILLKSGRALGVAALIVLVADAALLVLYIATAFGVFSP